MTTLSKINNLLTNKGTQKGQPSFGLSCVVHELFMTPHHTVQHIYFETNNKVPCLLYINPENFEIHNDSLKKATTLTPWSDYESSVGYVLTGNDEINVLPEISTSISPEPYINLLTMLSQTIKNTPYKFAVMIEDFLLVHNGETVDISNIKGCENPKLLIVVDLITLMSDLSITKIERVFDAINSIMIETYNKYWTNLHSLLLKCQKLKIITKGKANTDSMHILTKVVTLQSSDHAIKMALETLNLK
jgi:hypothetical protein